VEHCLDGAATEGFGRKTVRGPIYSIAGPPTVVAATRGTLAWAGVDEDDIRTEEFAGY
jgi:hypothetical protein